MTKEELERFKKWCIQTLKDWNLAYWRLKLSNTKRIVGQCSHYEMIIEISKAFCEVNAMEKMKAIFFHEMAHAISRGGHNKEFRGICKLLNAPKEVWGSHVKRGWLNLPKGKIVLKCPECGWEAHYHRISKRNKACAACCNKHNGGVYHEKYKLKGVVQ